jgi:GNAT superfamily N-acetyltransferase
MTLIEVNELAAELVLEDAAALARLDDDQRVAVQRLLARGLNLGWSDDQFQQKIARVIDLDPRSATAVENYRNKLLADNTPPARADRLSKQYADRLRAHRALVIAKTETQAALNEAQRQIWAEQQELGEVSRYAVRVFRVAKDERLCKMCRGLNGRRAALHGGYEAPSGFVAGPPLHPNCRCSEELVDEGILKTDPKLVWDGVTKHLPGRHNQKDHGVRYPKIKAVKGMADFLEWKGDDDVVFAWHGTRAAVVPPIFQHGLQHRGRPGFGIYTTRSLEEAKRWSGTHGNAKGAVVPVAVKRGPGVVVSSDWVIIDDVDRARVLPWSDLTQTKTEAELYREMEQAAEEVEKHGDKYLADGTPNPKYKLYHPGIGRRKARWKGAVGRQPENKDRLLPGDEGYDEGRKKTKAWYARLQYALAMNVVDRQEAAVLLGDEFSQTEHLTDFLDKWQPLPPRLWHVTTNVPGVLKHGLKTRDELYEDEQARGHGLGGGPSDVISFTDDLATAELIRDDMLAFRAALRGEVTPQDIIDKAREDGSLGYLLAEHYYGDEEWEDPNAEDIEPLPPHLWDMTIESLVHGIRRYHEDGEDWVVNVNEGQSEQYMRMQLRSLFRDSLRARQASGGKIDPVFFMMDEDALRNLDADNIGIVEGQPIIRNGEPTKGMKVSALGEWRTVADAVTINTVKKHGDPERDPVQYQFLHPNSPYFRRRYRRPVGQARRVTRIMNRLNRANAPDDRKDYWTAQFALSRSARTDDNLYRRAKIEIDENWDNWRLAAMEPSQGDRHRANMALVGQTTEEPLPPVVDEHGSIIPLTLGELAEMREISREEFLERNFNAGTRLNRPDQERVVEEFLEIAQEHRNDFLAHFGLPPERPREDIRRELRNAMSRTPLNPPNLRFAVLRGEITREQRDELLAANETERRRNAVRSHGEYDFSRNEAWLTDPTQPGGFWLREEEHEEEEHGDYIEDYEQDETDSDGALPNLIQEVAVGDHIPATGIVYRTPAGHLHPESEARIREMYTADLGDHYASEATMVSENYTGSVSVRGIIINKDTGNEVGDWSVSLDDQTARHGSMNLEPHAQGAGVATHWRTHMAPYYWQYGIEEVRVSANVDVGGYSWAKAGFQWGAGKPYGVLLRLQEYFGLEANGAPAISSYGLPVEGKGTGHYSPGTREAAGRIMAAFQNPDPSTWPTPQDIAALGAGVDDYTRATNSNPMPSPYNSHGSDQQIQSWPGKDIMLHSSWEAVMKLPKRSAE